MARKSPLGCLMAVLVIIFLIILAGLPRFLLFTVYREGVRLVELIKDYKTKYGIYPDDLSRLETKSKYDDKGWRGIRYTTSDNKDEFTLVCYGLWTFREVYNSDVKQWRSLD